MMTGAGVQVALTIWDLRGLLRATALVTAGVLTLLTLAAAAVFQGRLPNDAAGWQPPLVAPVTQRFGCTAWPFEPVGGQCPPRAPYFHSGVDLAAAEGTEVHAAAAGKLEVLPFDPAGFGTALLLDHGAGQSSLYAHLSAILAEPKALVGAGQVIARVGSTGHSTGPHLHFEIRVDGRPVDPLAWLPALHGGDG